MMHIHTHHIVKIGRRFALIAESPRGRWAAEASGGQLQHVGPLYYVLQQCLTYPTIKALREACGIGHECGPDNVQRSRNLDQR